MKRFATGLLTAVAISCLAIPASAQTLGNAKLAFHITDIATKNQCTTNSPIDVACSTFTVAGDVGVSYALYLMVSNGNLTSPGIAGATLGIKYDGAAASGADVFGWNRCSDLEFPGGGWPESGGGNVLTWAASTNCQLSNTSGEGYQAVAGWFYVYAYTADKFELTAREFVPAKDLAVADCNAAETQIALAATAFVRFSAGATEQGCNPCTTSCDRVPVDATTWGKLKSTYGSGD